MTEIDRDLSLAEAAGEIVSRRLEPIPSLLERALSFELGETEAVHDLRVAIRRAEASMRAFRQCFSAKRWARVRKMLRRIRRAAGHARTCDVHILLLEAHRESTDAEDRPALEHAIAETSRARIEAQDELVHIARRYPTKQIVKRSRKLVSRTRVAEVSLLDAASHELPKFVDRVRRAGEKDLTELESLHALRIRGKGLRYAIEIFSPCFDTGFRKRVYAPVKRLQDLLGEINDDHEIACRLHRLAAACSRGDAALAAGLRRLGELAETRCAAKCRSFLPHWNEFRDECALNTLDEWASDAADRAA